MNGDLILLALNQNCNQESMVKFAASLGADLYMGMVVGIPCYG